MLKSARAFKFLQLVDFNSFACTFARSLGSIKNSDQDLLFSLIYSKYDVMYFDVIQRETFYNL